MVIDASCFRTIEQELIHRKKDMLKCIEDINCV